jgi:aspartate/methionine/tyrosine aminotransferase
MPAVELTPFRIERWYERYEFTTELMLSSSDCETVSVSDLLDLEPDARARLDGLRLGYTEVPGSPELRAAIAGLYERTRPEDVVALAAAEEGILAVEHAVLGPGVHAIVETPCYESALAVARSTGAEVDVWRRTYADGWAHDLGALERLLRPETRLVYVNTPHNPTGVQMPREALDAVVALCAERGAVLFCDEVYRELEHDADDRLPAACDLYERAVSLGTVSKTYGLPGLRTGWIACRDPALRDEIVAVKLYTTICSSAPSELLAALALRHRERLAERNRALVLENLGLADAFVAAHPGLVDWVRPTASPIGFPRLRVPDTQEFCERLAAEEGVLLLPGEVYDEPGHVRFGLGRLGAAEAFARLSSFVERGVTA